MASSMLFLGALIGMMGSGFHVLLVSGEMRGSTIWALLFGGGFGGLVAVVLLEPTGGLWRQHVMLIGLSGYFVADIAAALVTGGRRKC